MSFRTAQQYSSYEAARITLKETVLQQMENSTGGRPKYSRCLRLKAESIVVATTDARFGATIPALQTDPI